MAHSMEQTFRDRPFERRLLLSILFAGGYPSAAIEQDSLHYRSLSLRRLDYSSRDALVYLKQQRWVEEVTDSSEEKSLRLTPSGFSKVLEDAKAILKTRFFLGLQPIPPEGSVELTAQSEIASALLLFLHFRELTFFDDISGFLGIPYNERAAESVIEFSSRKLIQREDLPRFQEDWYEITVRGRDACEFWLSGKPGAEWPFRALSLANRRHRPENKTSTITSLDVRELTSIQLEHLALEYARRELKLQYVRHVGGSGDGGSDVLAEERTEKGIRGVLLQAKQTAENSLRLTKVKNEFRRLVLPDREKPWEYILFTNAKDSRDLGDAVSKGALEGGFSHSTVISRTSLESFLNKKENQDLIPRFFPRRVLPSGDETRLPRPSGWQPASQIFREILQEYFSNKRGQLIVEDLEYEGIYPYVSDSNLAPSEWFKASVMDWDEDGLIYGSTVDGMLYRIPFEAMVLWDQWTRDEIEGLPHLFVAGLDRIEPLNKSYSDRKAD